MKSSERLLREEIKRFRDSEDTVTQSQDDIIKAKEAIDKERQELKIDKKTLANLRSEHSRLKDDFRWGIEVKLDLVLRLWLLN